MNGEEKNQVKVIEKYNIFFVLIDKYKNQIDKYKNEFFTQVNYNLKFDVLLTIAFGITISIGQFCNISANVEINCKFIAFTIDLFGITFSTINMFSLKNNLKFNNINFQRVLKILNMKTVEFLEEINSNKKHKEQYYDKMALAVLDFKQDYLEFHFMQMRNGFLKVTLFVVFWIAIAIYYLDIVTIIGNLL